MNTWLSWRPDGSMSTVVRAALRRGTRVSQHLFSVVGACAIVVALVLWLLPTVRGTLAARLMPFISAAVKAGPARLLSGHPLPSLGGVTADSDGAELGAASLDNTKFDGAFDGSGGSGGNGLSASGAVSVATDARSASGLDFAAKMISAQRVAADARDDRVIVPTREQSLVTSFLARRYHVAQEPVGELVKAAFDTGRQVGLDPLLLLAVMAIESGFNPYAESGVGAQGLMQVMSKVHSDKFQYFGGTSAALEPFANITVGALVLKDCIARGGSLPDGLRLYVGSTSPDDGGYGAKVMAERDRLRAVARGQSVPINTPQAPRQVVTASKQRVQVALEGGHVTAVAKPSAGGSSVPTADDVAPTAAHHGTTELGA